LNLESYFISKVKNRHIGDDGAFIENIDANVFSKDAFFEDVHFKTKWISYYDIAKKAMLVNISDAIAMNAKPMYALLSIAMPCSITKYDIDELIRGFNDIASYYNIEIIGGDTISNTKLDITITIISKSTKPLKRKGLKQNYLLAYTGKLGDSKKDLKKLFNLGKIHRKSKFVDIKLQQKFIQNTSRFLKVGMDISDGLFSDLSKLAQINGMGFKFFKSINRKIGCSGEEYEMLIGFDKRDKKTLKRRAIQNRTKLNIFAISKRVRYKNICKAHHF
jgi:thiamine-monophosphate kinase